MGPHERVVAAFGTVEASLNDRLPAGLKVGFLTLYAHTERGDGIVDAVAARGPWRRWHDLGIATLVAVMLAGLGSLAWIAAAVLGRDVSATAANQANNVLAIPGVNDFMPVAATAYVVLGLLVATVAHEGGHALALRTEDLPIDELGVALFAGFVPLAAYVKPTDALDAAPARSRLRVFAAGVTNNVAVTALVVAGFLAVGVEHAVDAYLIYFGWLYTSAAAPTAADVAAVGAVANALFWTGFLNANLAVLNALPIWPFDGGKVARVAVEGLEDRVPLADLRPVWVGASALTALVVALVVVGPALL